jgi:uncharacterized membrane protein
MKPETRDNLNLAVTILAFVMIPVAGAFLNSKLDTQTATITAHSDAAVSSLKQEMTDKFETKDSHNADLQAVKDWNRTISTKVDTDHEQTMAALGQHSLALQALTDALANGRTTTTTTTTKSTEP